MGEKETSSTAEFSYEFYMVKQFHNGFLRLKKINNNNSEHHRKHAEISTWSDIVEEKETLMRNICGIIQSYFT